MKKYIKLPEKQSELLRLAVKDAQKIQKNKKYILNMGEWHTPINSDYYNYFTNQNIGKCAVCLAGSVIACTLKAPLNKYATPSTIELVGDNYEQLQLINSMRDGGFKYLGSDQDRITAVQIAHELVTKNYNYRLDRAPWKIYLRAASILEFVGL